jgi:hypothetical protein
VNSSFVYKLCAEASMEQCSNPILLSTATSYPDFLFPFLFFREPLMLLSASSAMSRARFGCRPSGCTGDPAATDTACSTSAGFASGSCSPPDGLFSTLSLPSAGSTTGVPGITSFGSENTARYVLRVSRYSPSDCQQVAKSERRRITHAHEGREIWVWL